MRGGDCGARGSQRWVRCDGSRTTLGPVDECDVAAGTSANVDVSNVAGRFSATQKMNIVSAAASQPHAVSVHTPLGNSNPPDAETVCFVFAASRTVQRNASFARHSKS